jgi:hypothetical protein
MRPATTVSLLLATGTAKGMRGLESAPVLPSQSNSSTRAVRQLPTAGGAPLVRTTPPPAPKFKIQTTPAASSIEAQYAINISSASAIIESAAAAITASAALIGNKATNGNNATNTEPLKTLEEKVKKIAKELIQKKEQNKPGSLRTTKRRDLQVIAPIDLTLDGTETATRILRSNGEEIGEQVVNLNTVWNDILDRDINDYIIEINTIKTDNGLEAAVYKCALDATKLLIKPRECDSMDGLMTVQNNRIVANGILAIMDQLTGKTTKEETDTAIRSLSSETVKLPAQIGLIILNDITERRNALETKILKDDYNMEQSDINNLQNMHSDIQSFPFQEMDLGNQAETEVTNLETTYNAAMLKRYIVAGTETATVETSKEVTLNSLFTETETLDWPLFPNPFPEEVIKTNLFDEIKQLQEDINDDISNGLTQDNFETTVTKKKTLLEKHKELVNSIENSDPIMTLFDNKYKSKSEIISSIDSAMAETEKRHWIGKFMKEMNSTAASDFAKQALNADKAANDTGESHAYKQFVKFKSNNKIQDPLDYLVSKVKEGNSKVSESILKIEKIIGNLDKITSMFDEQDTKTVVTNYLDWTQKGDLRTDLEQAKLVYSQMKKNQFIVTEQNYNILVKDSTIYKDGIDGLVDIASKTIQSIATAVSEAWMSFFDQENIKRVKTALKSILEQGFEKGKAETKADDATFVIDIDTPCHELLKDNCTAIEQLATSQLLDNINGTTTKNQIKEHYNKQFKNKEIRRKLVRIGKDAKQSTRDGYTPQLITTNLSEDILRAIFNKEPDSIGNCSNANSTNSSQYQIYLDPANNTDKFNQICTDKNDKHFKSTT